CFSAVATQARLVSLQRSKCLIAMQSEAEGLAVVGVGLTSGVVEVAKFPAGVAAVAQAMQAQREVGRVGGVHRSTQIGISGVGELDHDLVAIRHVGGIALEA